MAVPKVFVSSTYYDLKQYRSNIESFILSLGYEAIMHERAKVAYTQTQPLELDCYHELASCDIVVCIIGNHFGTKSSESDLSITMEELKTALKNKKKIYVFISNDVYIENRTYKLNRDNENFKSAYTDNIKIHEYIAELTEAVKNHVIMPFETTDQIVSVLKAQFAGLFQNLLARESSMTEAKTTYDLQETADNIKSLISDFSREKEMLFEKFDCTFITNNYTLTVLKQHIGLKNSAFFANDLESLKEIMHKFGYWENETYEANAIVRFKKQYVDDDYITTEYLGLDSQLFSENDKLIPIRNLSFAEEHIHFHEDIQQISRDELPF